MLEFGLGLRFGLELGSESELGLEVGVRVSTLSGLRLGLAFDNVYRSITNRIYHKALPPSLELERLSPLSVGDPLIAPTIDDRRFSFTPPMTFEILRDPVPADGARAVTGDEVMPYM